jgi:hypothetical protein
VNSGVTTGSSAKRWHRCCERGLIVGARTRVAGSVARCCIAFLDGKADCDWVPMGAWTAHVFSEQGANILARLVATGVESLNLRLASFLESPRFLPEFDRDPKFMKPEAGIQSATQSVITRTTGGSCDNLRELTDRLGSASIGAQRGWFETIAPEFSADLAHRGMFGIGRL